MGYLTIEDVIKACKGRLLGEYDTSRQVIGAKVDSREVKPGNVFFAGKGERTDGFNFIGKAFEAGAACVVCEREPEEGMGPCILVEDAYQALRDVATAYRKRLTIPVVGITGSVGKTSTKEAIAAVLSAKYRVSKTEGNFNNQIGVPLTVMAITMEHEAAVVEMGISDFGEMEVLAEIAKPDICVITNIGFCHLEQLGTREGILKAKSEMWYHRNSKGAVILNGDDDLLSGIFDADGTKPTMFGFSQGCDYRISDVKLRGLMGVDFSLNDRHFSTNMPGEHSVMNAACGAAVGYALGLTHEEIARGLKLQKPLAGRANIMDKNGVMVIDDCYNANPVSMKKGIELLCLSDTRKVAILGDMFELGEKSASYHAGVGEFVDESSVDLLITVGELSKNISDACRNSRITRVHFDTVEELTASLGKYIKKGDAVLVKASHGMHLERVIEAL